MSVQDSNCGPYDAEKGAEGAENRVNLIINYLPQNFTDHDMYKIFIDIGPIKSCRIMKDLKTGYSYGYGFVEYERPEDATKAISQLNNLAIQHKRIKVSYARPPGEDIKETNLYIQHLPRFYNEEELEKLFSPFGKIVQRNIVKDKITGIPKGIGFVRFDKKMHAQAAIEAMHGRIPQNGTDALVVRIAEDHGKARGAVMFQGGPNMRGYAPPMGGQGFGRGNFNYNNGNGNGMYQHGRGHYGNAGGKMQSGRMARRYNPVGGGANPFFPPPFSNY